LGWIAEIGAMVIPGVGPFIAAGPIIAALSGAAIGATVGGIAGGLIGLGIPEIQAKRYEGKVKAGNILLSVHTENSEEITRAKDIFTKAGAEGICATGEASTPKDSKAANRAPHPDETAFSRHGTKRVAKAALISAVPPLMLKTDANPGGSRAVQAKSLALINCSSPQVPPCAHQPLGRHIIRLALLLCRSVKPFNRCRREWGE
jgi:hypothetical protein